MFIATPGAYPEKFRCNPIFCICQPCSAMRFVLLNRGYNSILYSLVLLFNLGMVAMMKVSPGLNSLSFTNDVISHMYSASTFISHLKLRNLCLIAALFVMGGCATSGAKQKEMRNIHATFYDDYEPNLIKFNQEIDQSLTLRKRAVEFFTQERLEGEEQYFNANDISRVQTSVEEYQRNRDVLLYDIANRYRQLIEDVELVFTTDKPSGLEFGFHLAGAGNGDRLYVNPKDQKGKEYIKAIKLGLAATLTLYDNFIIAIMPYQENGHFRRKINYDNIDNNKIIEKISGNFRRLDNYKDTLLVVEFNEQLLAWEKENPDSVVSKDKDNGYLNVLIQGSYTNKRITEITLVDRLAFRTVRLRRILRDILFDVGNDSMNAVSKLFGNGMGLVSSRQGYLKNIPETHVDKMESQMKAGDILLEKTPFRLTDRFIPGHWGHVAIWTGTEQELRDIGLWNELPSLHKNAQKRFGYEGPPFQQQIRNGHMIIEALRPGVQINRLTDFLNIDDMAVLRDNSVSRIAMKRYLQRAFEQVGKEYDFNFDVETDKKIVCSELAFVTYDDYQWPVAKTAGRYTISPDHVGIKAKGDGPFEPVILYHDGKLIEQNIQKNFNHLMDFEYDRVQIDLLKIE